MKTIAKKDSVALRTDSGRPSRSKYERGTVVKISGCNALVDFLHVSGCIERAWVSTCHLAKIKKI